MNNKYINLYDYIVNLTRNKDLYNGIEKEDSFSDRLTFFLLHFAFLLRNFKTKTDKQTLQNIYDFIFRQLELSIREIGYGDQTINKKMKDYLNLFYSIIDKIDSWNELSETDKYRALSIFINFDIKNSNLVDYFDKYEQKLLNITLNSLIKSVIKP